MDGSLAQVPSAPTGLRDYNSGAAADAPMQSALRETPIQRNSGVGQFSAIWTNSAYVDLGRRELASSLLHSVGSLAHGRYSPALCLRTLLSSVFDGESPQLPGVSAWTVGRRV